MTCIDKIEGKKKIFTYFLFYLIIIWPVWIIEVIEFELREVKIEAPKFTC